MKRIFVLILIGFFACKNSSKQKKIMPYSMNYVETIKGFHFYLMLNSNKVDSIYKPKYGKEYNCTLDSIEVGYNINQIFLNKIVKDEEIVFSDSTSILAYIHKLTNNALIDSYDKKWIKLYQVFRSTIKRKYRDVNSKEYLMYQNIFFEIERLPKNKIYFFDKVGLQKDFFYCPIYSLSLSEQDSIIFKVMTCDYSLTKLNVIPE